MLSSTLGLVLTGPEILQGTLYRGRTTSTFQWLLVKRKWTSTSLLRARFRTHLRTWKHSKLPKSSSKPRTLTLSPTCCQKMRRNLWLGCFLRLTRTTMDISQRMKSQKLSSTILETHWTTRTSRRCSIPSTCLAPAKLNSVSFSSHASQRRYCSLLKTWQLYSRYSTMTEAGRYQKMKYRECSVLRRRRSAWEWRRRSYRR